MTAKDVRDHLVDSLKRELIGPDPGRPAMQWHGPGSPLNGEEILRPQDRPRMRYGAGILFPNGMTYSGLLDSTLDLPESSDSVVPNEPDAITPDATVAEPDDADDAPDEEAPSLNSFVPSSMGISFLADTAGGMEVELRWATYAPQDLPGWTGERAGTGKPWFRTPATETVTLPARRGAVSQTETHLAGGQGPALLVVDRPWESDRLRLITVTMLNTRASSAFIEDEDCYFQCGLDVRPIGGSVIHPYPGRPDAELNSEERSLKLLYRHRPSFAVGHGCAADWTSTGDTASSVRTETLPTVEQPPVLPRAGLPGVNLSMLGLSLASDAEVIASCTSLIDAYGVWIADRRADVPGLGVGPDLAATADDHLDLCTESLGRIRDGIDILRKHPDAMIAFRWMNGAMVEQRAHYALSAEKDLRRGWLQTPDGVAPERAYVTPEYSDRVAWRPFQLAFILMNLKSMVERHSPERDIVDVIWFPTGGGKTEAYLGLAAWTMLYRRLCDPDDAGVSVLMRYTLRLLTAQQFQRASSLICALELLRRDNAKVLGAEPFTIGLWLGAGVTPNSDKKAIEALAELNRGDGKNPFVVLSCPWCGVEMGPRTIGKTSAVFGYRKVAGSVRFVCDDGGCPFSQGAGLPLEVIDERIYAHPPTLVIGTVDKFAMLPWTPDARRLFGLDYRGVSAPDLIIQDELHLISGPLGSMVGHYETLIEALCVRHDATGSRLTPKIVASTATISRADEQVLALYARPARLFPPQALQAGDSFFAEERTDLDGRLYVGALGSGLSSHIVAQIRLTAALLQAPASLRPTLPSGDVDPYWSLVTYFNSLRELGRASTLIHADIREYLRWVWQRTGVGEDAVAPGDGRRYINESGVVELTSRVLSSEIPEVLERLFTGIPDRTAVDVCFATNMIQVGLDVPRLSLMMIVGQPKGASEYIQASSRVGRDLTKPGLVVTNYNPFKPRDRSHFETFRQYHENIYRFVEPTSVTPFSLPVNDRAVHALAIALVRCLEPSLREAPGLGPPEALRGRVRDIILDRVARVAPDEAVRTSLVLDRFLDAWSAKRPPRYGGFGPKGEGRPLMIPAGRVWGDGEDPIPKATPSSMRSVDGESGARVLSHFEHGNT